MDDTTTLRVSVHNISINLLTLKAGINLLKGAFLYFNLKRRS